MIFGMEFDGFLFIKMLLRINCLIAGVIQRVFRNLTRLLQTGAYFFKISPKNVLHNIQHAMGSSKIIVMSQKN